MDVVVEGNEQSKTLNIVSRIIDQCMTVLYIVHILCFSYSWVVKLLC